MLDGTANRLFFARSSHRNGCVFMMNSVLLELVSFSVKKRQGILSEGLSETDQKPVRVNCAIILGRRVSSPLNPPSRVETCLAEYD